LVNFFRVLKKNLKCKKILNVGESTSTTAAATSTFTTASSANAGTVTKDK